jgi:hypothetical protein
MPAFGEVLLRLISLVHPSAAIISQSVAKSPAVNGTLHGVLRDRCKGTPAPRTKTGNNAVKKRPRPRIISQKGLSVLRTPNSMISPKEVRN